MTGRRMFMALCAFWPVAALAQAVKPARRKWYVTGGYTLADGRVRVPGNDPIIAYGTDRIDAISRCGFTVWSEADWAELDEQYKK